MKKLPAFILAIILLQGCAVLSDQYYYVPSTGYQTTKEEHGYFKMLNMTTFLKDSLGNYLGSVRNSSEVGIPLLAGPPYVPVLPVGLVTVFIKSEHQFEMNFSVQDTSGHFIRLAYDSATYKRLVHPSPNTYRDAPLPVDAGKSYLLVNGVKKVPLTIVEFVDNNGYGYNYRVVADISFARVRTATIITGNPLLNQRLSRIVFRRRRRLTYSIMELN